jgi:hypothetical protein
MKISIDIKKNMQCGGMKFAVVNNDGEWKDIICEWNIASNILPSNWLKLDRVPVYPYLMINAGVRGYPRTAEDRFLDITVVRYIEELK